MSGIYGNDPYDRYWENKLDEHLDNKHQDEISVMCDACGYAEQVDCDEYEQVDIFICPECGKFLKKV